MRGENQKAPKGTSTGSGRVLGHPHSWITGGRLATSRVGGITSRPEVIQSSRLNFKTRHHGGFHFLQVLVRSSSAYYKSVDYLEEFGSNTNTIKIPSASTKTNHLLAFAFTRLGSCSSCRIIFFPALRSPFQNFLRKNFRRCFAHSPETVSCPFLLCAILDNAYSIRHTFSETTFAPYLLNISSILSSEGMFRRS